MKREAGSTITSFHYGVQTYECPNPPPYKGDASEKGSISDYEERVSMENVEMPDRVEDSHWTTVVRRHVQESFERNNNNKNQLSAEQVKTVTKATAGMTAEQRKQVQQ